MYSFIIVILWTSSKWEISLKKDVIKFWRPWETKGSSKIFKVLKGQQQLGHYWDKIKRHYIQFRRQSRLQLIRKYSNNPNFLKLVLKMLCTSMTNNVPRDIWQFSSFVQIYSSQFSASPIARCSLKINPPASCNRREIIAKCRD